MEMRVPPNNPDFEKAVLGAILLETGTLRKVPSLTGDQFYSEAHRTIFDSCKRLDAVGKPIDILSVKQELETKGKLEGVGGAVYLSELTSKVASAAHIEYHAKIMAESWVKREVIKRAGAAIDAAYSTHSDAFDLTDKLQSDLHSLQNRVRRGKSVRSISEIAAQAMEQQVAIQEQKRTKGVLTPWREINEYTSGFHGGDLIYLAARPAMGKTSFAMRLARFVAERKQPVGIFSLEMGDVSLVNRMVTAHSGVDAQLFRKGRLENSEWARAIDSYGYLSNLPIFIDDTAALGIHEMRSKTQELVDRHGVKLLLIDYLQLATIAHEKGRNREQEVATISKALKQIAKDFDIPVMCLCQLSRAVETRGGDKKPILSDLRESGSIEQDADMVFFLYRPEYYGLDTYEDGSSTQGVAEVIIAKQRNGPTGDVKLNFSKSTQDWTDYGGIDYGKPEFQVRNYTEPNRDPDSKEGLPF